MAATPGVLHIGDAQVQGGSVPLNVSLYVDRLVPTTQLSQFGDRNLMRITPDDPVTGAPTSDSLGAHLWYSGSSSVTTYQVAAVTATTLTVAGSPGWANDLWNGRILTIVGVEVPFVIGVSFQHRAVVIDTTGGNTLTVSATGPVEGAHQIQFGRRYQIVTTGTTNFTLAGAPSSAPGTQFTATDGPLPGNGTAIRIPEIGANSQVFIGSGRFESYHPAAGFLHSSEGGVPSFRGGSGWEAGGRGLGMDATAVRRFLEDVWPESPYFHYFKWADFRSVHKGWAEAPNNAARALFLAEMIRVEAAAADRGNTIDWEVAILDASVADILFAVGDPSEFLFYQARMVEWITWLRSAAVMDNATAKIVLVNHDSDLLAVAAPGASLFLRQAHTAIARADPNVGILDMQGRAPYLGATPAADFDSYAYREYFWQGEEAVRVYRRLAAGTPATVGGGLPVYCLFGDSAVVGEISAAWTTELHSPTLSGATHGVLTRSVAQLIFNGATLALEVHTPHSNSNTVGTISSKASYEYSLMNDLEERHPDGFAMIKVGVAGSGLASSGAAWTETMGSYTGGLWTKAANENYTLLLDAVSAAFSYMNNTLGFQADMRGLIVSLGGNDQAVDPDGGTDFALALPGFVADLVDDLQTRTSGATLGIAFRRPQTDAANANPERTAQVHAALAALASGNSRVRIVNFDGLERIHEDDLHETPISAIDGGHMLAAAIAQVSQ